MSGWLLAFLVLCSYLVGSICFGRILSTKMKVDVTKQGSGNVGATNMLRAYGAKLGFSTLFLDLLKGIIPALVGFLAFGGGSNIPESYIGLYACGLASVIGHIFPIFFEFKGGKAAATACGVFLVAQPVIALCAFVLCFVLACITKYVSPMSLLFILINVVWQNIFMPEFTVFLPNFSLAVLLLTIAIMLAVYGAHWKNIVRLVQGKETKTDIVGKMLAKSKKSKNLPENAITKEEKAQENVTKGAENQEEKDTKNSSKN